MQMMTTQVELKFSDASINKFTVASERQVVTTYAIDDCRNLYFCYSPHEKHRNAIEVL